MPKRTDLKSILIIGSGPIVIGQGAEFDYSGVQACRALKEEGYRIVLVNSNPATIMTDPQFADATYVEPITPEAVEKILAREKRQGTPVDAVLPTLGGQTGLNVAMACFDKGIFEKYGVEMIGANREAIWRGEDRQAFKDLMVQIGLKVPISGVVHTWEEAQRLLKEVGLPAIIRPAFTLGGTGGGIAYNTEEYEEIVTRGLEASPYTEVLIEQSVIGWKEFELEVIRDKADNAIVVCSIENIDPMGVHTGDSITVAPIQTLTDKEYQRMRDAALAVIRAVGVETGGSNIQFAVNPANGEMVVVEMNPRVSRSSALASKATGFPIAKIAAKLAVGYTLDELPNDITKKTVAAFEPTIDYVVVKMPRWTFEKFPEADETLTTQMKSVGEAMAIGRTFKEALQKAIRSMEVGRFGLGLDKNDKWLRGTGAPPVSGSEEHTGEAPVPRPDWPIPEETLRRKLAVPSQGRLYYVRYALKMGWSVEQVHELTKIDPWFLHQIREVVEAEDGLIRLGREVQGDDDVWRLIRSWSSFKRLGYSDVQIENVWGMSRRELLRKSMDIDTGYVMNGPVYKLVDTCAAEFEAATPYYYSTYETPFELVGGGEPGSAEHAQVPFHRSAVVSNRSEMTSNRPETTSDRPETTSDRLETTSDRLETTSDRLEATADRLETDGSRILLADDEIRITDRPKVIIIGGGPNRIGQGIEFDYCCVQAAYAMRELGYESVMINSNPETVSTDYDTSDLLFFEPLTHEDVLNICERLNGGAFGERGGGHEGTKARRHEGEEGEPASAGGSGLVKGVIVQFGGQTPLNLAKGLEEAGVPILGTSVDAIHRAGSREQFRGLIQALGLKQPPNGIARNLEDAREIAALVGYPVLVRPSFVLGGRAMEIVYDETALNRYMTAALAAAGITGIADSPILIDKFLDNATEVDVDCVADFNAAGEGRSVIAGVMEHIEEAGIHSGDSAAVLPPYSLSDEIVAELKSQTHALAKALQVRGLMNVQYAVKDGQVYVIEVNPRASRTVPFVGKATGVPWANIAAKVMAGKSLDELGVYETPPFDHVAVKEAVFPFPKFPGVDIILGPEMRSTGEVMGIDTTFGLAYAKGQLAEGTKVPLEGSIFISVRDADKPLVLPIARKFAELGFQILSTSGTHKALTEAGISATRIPKIAEQARPNLVDHIKNGQVQLILNTATKKGAGTDEAKIRAVAFRNRIPIVTTITGGKAFARAIEALREGEWDVRPLQDYHAAVRR